MGVPATFGGNRGTVMYERFPFPSGTRLTAHILTARYALAMCGRTVG